MSGACSLWEGEGTAAIVGEGRGRGLVAVLQELATVERQVTVEGRSGAIGVAIRTFAMGASSAVAV